MLSFTESGKNLYIEYIVFIMLGKKTLHTEIIEDISQYKREDVLYKYHL